MASGNMKDIKRRMKSVQSTMQITKAMELVASSKLRHAKERVIKSRPYFNTMYETMARIAKETPRGRFGLHQGAYGQKEPVYRHCGRPRPCGRL